MTRRSRTTTRRPSVPPQSIDGPSFGALRSLAENPETSPDTLALLSHDPRLEVRVAVVWNARTPPPALARNPSVPYGVLTALTQDADPEVRRTAEAGVHAPKG